MSSNPPAPAPSYASNDGPAPRTILGHPVGLYVLFFTELWERFSFYGMKTLLMLYMVNSFVWSQEKASAHMGWYTMLAYAMPVLGGLVADRYLGAWRATFLGGVLLAIGHFLMAFEPLPFFYSALAFIIAGVGLLKPNISTQVGSLYAPGDPRRDGAFTIFYMGINLGAFIGPLLCDWLRVRYGYHYGFGAAGVGMVLGLIVYVLGRPALVTRSATIRAAAPTAAEEAAPHVVRDRLIVLVIIFAFVVLFWMAFEQSSNVLLIWADKHTNLRPFSSQPPPVLLDGAAPTATAAGGLAAFEITSGQTQSLNPFFIITLAPVFAFFWLWLEKRKLQPSTPAKMVLGLTAVVVAYGIMWPAALLENGPSRAPLAEVPAGVKLEEFGATRLRYDASRRSLELNGVLPDLDRLRLLAQAAPPEIASAVDALAQQAAARAKDKQAPKNWEVAVPLPTAPSDYRISGVAAPHAARWDPDNRSLIATQELSDRARLELLAPAAPAEFRSAVDALYVNSGQYRVSVWWLVLFFLVITMGELCLSPVGLSLVTKLAPPRHVGILMGGWFLATAIANKAAHFLGGSWGKMPPLQYFMMFLVICAVGALILAVLVRPMRRMMHGVK